MKLSREKEQRYCEDGRERCGVSVADFSRRKPRAADRQTSPRFVAVKEGKQRQTAGRGQTMASVQLRWQDDWMAGGWREGCVLRERWGMRKRRVAIVREGTHLRAVCGLWGIRWLAGGRGWAPLSDDQLAGLGRCVTTLYAKQWILGVDTYMRIIASA